MRVLKLMLKGVSILLISFGCFISFAANGMNVTSLVAAGIFLLLISSLSLYKLNHNRKRVPSNEQTDKENKIPLQRRILLLSFTFGVTLCLGGILILPGMGFGDFPCFFSVEDDTLFYYGPPYRVKAYTFEKDAILLVTDDLAGMTGSGCQISELDEGESYQLDEYQVTVEEGYFVIDGEIELNVGERFRDENKGSGLNPWWRYEDHIELTNQGFVKTVVLDTEEPIELSDELLVLIGGTGTKLSFNPVTVTIFCSSLAITLVLGGSLSVQFIQFVIKKIKTYFASKSSLD